MIPPGYYPVSTTNNSDEDKSIKMQAKLEAHNLPPYSQYIGDKLVSLSESDIIKFEAEKKEKLEAKVIAVRKISYQDKTPPSKVELVYCRFIASFGRTPLPLKTDEDWCKVHFINVIQSLVNDNVEIAEKFIILMENLEKRFNTSLEKTSASRTAIQVMTCLKKEDYDEVEKIYNTLKDVQLKSAILAIIAAYKERNPSIATSTLNRILEDVKETLEDVKSDNVKETVDESWVSISHLKNDKNLKDFPKSEHSVIDII